MVTAGGGRVSSQAGPPPKAGVGFACPTQEGLGSQGPVPTTAEHMPPGLRGLEQGRHFWTVRSPGLA